MKKVTFLLLLMFAGLGVMQVSAQPAKGPAKAPARSQVYNYKPSGYIALGTYDNPNHIYYSTQTQYALHFNGRNGMDVNGVSIIGEVDGNYYSTTYAHPLSKVPDESNATSDAGCGFLAAMYVDGLLTSPVVCDCQNGTTSRDVRFTARVERAGEYGARIVYTLTNNAWLLSRTVSLGVWADIMIGDNDNAPIYCLRNEQGKVYGLDMKYKKDEDAQPGEKVPVFTAIFDGASGVTPVDDWWFGRYSNNYNASEIVGNYDNKCDVQHGSGSDATWEYDVVDEFYKVEGEYYDSGMGFCWRNITLEAGESVELSFLVSASEIDIDEPEPDPEAEYHVEVYNTEAWNDLAADHPAHVWGYYKHPFDWTSHMEYMVDGDRGTGEWTAIPGELAPNSEFDLPFNLNFNPDVADIHTLKLRLVDIEGNATYLEDLNKEWEDIRSIDLTVNPQTQYYDATPKTFVVTVGGAIDYTLGENGEYVDPGTYDFSIYGDYDMETIGVNTVEFSIVRRQAGLDVTVPEDCIYDGNEHAATASTDGDGTVIITYKDAEGNISTDAPVEPGTYEVFVEVTDGEFTDGMENTSYGEFTISKMQQELVVNVPEDCVYDGEEHAATATLTSGDGDVTITYVNSEGEVSTEAPVLPGTYEVFVEVSSAEYYDGIQNKSYGEFTIDRAPCEFEATLPAEQIKYDGKQHGATVTVPEGSGNVTIVYQNLATGEKSETAPSEVGRYIIILSIDDSGELYYGMEDSVILNYEIYLIYPTAVNELNVDGLDNGAWYTIDGRRVAAPSHGGIYIRNGKKYIVK